MYECIFRNPCQMREKVKKGKENVQTRKKAFFQTINNKLEDQNENPMKSNEIRKYLYKILCCFFVVHNKTN